MTNTESPRLSNEVMKTKKGLNGIQKHKDFFLEWI